jgi:hypothetical protein
MVDKYNILYSDDKKFNQQNWKEIFQVMIECRAYEIWFSNFIHNIDEN